MEQNTVQYLEKLVSDLKNERQKCLVVQQENSIYRIEVEGLKQSLARSQEQIDQLIQENQNLKESISEEQQKNGKIEESLIEEMKEIERKQQDWERKELEYEYILQESSNMNDISSQKLSESEELLVSFESQLALKDEMIEQLKQQILDKNHIIDQLSSKDNNLLHEKDITIRELKSKIKSSEQQILQIQFQFEDISERWKTSLASNHQLQDTIRSQQKEKDNLIKELQATRQQIEIQAIESKATQAELESLQQIYRKESKAYEDIQTLRLQYESALTNLGSSLQEERSKSQLLQTQLTHTRQDLEETRENIHGLESSLTTLKSSSLALQTENNRLTRLVASQLNSSNSNNSSNSSNNRYGVYEKDLSDLRQQLDFLKSQTNGSHSERLYTSEDLISCENRLQKVYNESINKLREEIDDLRKQNNQLELSIYTFSEELTRRFVEQIHVMPTVESNLTKSITSVIDSACESMERNVELNERNLKLLQIIDEFRQQYQSLQNQSHRELQRLDNINQSLERQLSQLTNSLNQSNEELESLKHERMKSLRSFEEYKSQLNTKESQLRLLESKVDQSENEYQSLEETTANLKQVLHNKTVEYDLLQNDSERWKTRYSTLMRENETIKSDLETSRQQHQMTLIDIQTLEGQLQDSQMVISKLQDDKAQYSLKEIRQETEFMTMKLKLSEEHEKLLKLKDEMIMSLQMDLVREKESANQTQTKINSMQDSLRLLMKELSSYRSLDIYQTTFRQELKNLKTTSSNSKSPQSLVRYQSDPKQSSIILNNSTRSKSSTSSSIIGKLSMKDFSS